jgi:hypothetical protein
MKWEKDEPLGDQSSISPVLYANINHSELKAQYPDWNERAKQIAKIWRRVPPDTKTPYLVSCYPFVFGCVFGCLHLFGARLSGQTSGLHKESVCNKNTGCFMPWCTVALWQICSKVNSSMTDGDFCYQGWDTEIAQTNCGNLPT